MCDGAECCFFPIGVFLSTDQNGLSYCRLTLLEYQQHLPVCFRCSPQTGDRAKPANRRGSAMYP